MTNYQVQNTAQANH